MKTTKFLTAQGGIDVIASETQLKPSRVRAAENVVLNTAGGYSRRKGARLVSERSLPHSAREFGGALYFGDTGTLYRMHDEALIEVVDSSMGAGPYRYAEQSGALYVMSGTRFIRVAGGVTVPGVVDLLGFTPTPVAAGNGGLAAGSYGVAIAAVVGGEESGLSTIARVDVAAGGSFSINIPALAVDAIRVYRTEANGTELYYQQTVSPLAGLAVVTLTNLGGEVEHDGPRTVLPYGTELGAHNGRLYSAQGSFLFYTEAYSHLYDPRKNFIRHEEECGTVILGMDGGLFVGTEKCVWWYAGGGPESFKPVLASSAAPFYHTGVMCDGSMFDEKITNGASQVAVWLSETGYQIGMPDGRVVPAQADRILLGASRGVTEAFIQKGVKQLISSVESMELGLSGAADRTLATS